MTKAHRLVHRYVEFIPKNIEEGVLYVSKRFRTASHLCCCGCGLRVVTPLNPAKWTLTDHGSSVSLSPSVGLGTFPCRSHYWIRRGRVDWYKPMTVLQTQRAQQRDQYDSQIYTGERKQTIGMPSERKDVQPITSSWLESFLSWLGLGGK